MYCIKFDTSKNFFIVPLVETDIFDNKDLISIKWGKFNNITLSVKLIKSKNDRINK